jgi:CheY-like chemotaxis protein
MEIDFQNAGPLLLIDDDAMSRELIPILLGLRGYAVETAEDGAAAIQLLCSKAQIPGVILLDAQMPGLNGVELIAQLRIHTQALIILISASEPSLALRSAVDGFLLKPFTADDMTCKFKEINALSVPYLLRNEWKTDAPAQSAGSAIQKENQEEPFLDANTVAQLRSMMPQKAVREIFTALAADLDRRVPALDAALTVQNFAEARRIGHAIKGGAAMAGAAEIARLGASIENGALEGTAPPTASEVNCLDNSHFILIALRQASANLRRILEESSGPLA